MSDQQIKEQHMMDMRLPITRDISCLQCGHDGVMDIRDESDIAADSRLFPHLGHNPFTGDLHYQCPACDIVLLVDPMLALGEKPVRGMPRLRTGKKTIRGEGLLHGSFSKLLARLFLNESDKRRLS